MKPDKVIYDETPPRRYRTKQEHEGLTKPEEAKGREIERKARVNVVIDELFARGNRAVEKLKDGQGKMKRGRRDALLAEVRWCRKRIEKLMKEQVK